MKFVQTLLVAMLMLGLMAPTFTSAQTPDPANEDALLAELLQDLAGEPGEVAPEPVPAEEDPVVEPMVEEPIVEEEVEMPAEEEAQEHNAAEDVLDLIANEIDSVWMNADGANAMIAPVSVDTTSVQIEFSQVTYEGAPIAQYKVYYGENAVGSDTGFDGLDSVVVSPMSRTDATATTEMIEITGLTAETTYYMYVVPVDPITNEDYIDLLTDEVIVTTGSAEAPASDAMIIDALSYTQSNNEVTVTWEGSLADAAEITLMLRHSDETEYTTLGTKAFDANSHTFTVTKEGTYFLKAQAIDENGENVGAERIQTLKVTAFTMPTAPVEAVPQVGPATNLLFALLAFASVAYLGFRVRKANV